MECDPNDASSCGLGGLCQAGTCVMDMSTVTPPELSTDGPQPGDPVVDLTGPIASDSAPADEGHASVKYEPIDLDNSNSLIGAGVAAFIIAIIILGVIALCGYLVYKVVAEKTGPDYTVNLNKNKKNKTYEEFKDEEGRPDGMSAEQIEMQKQIFDQIKAE